MLLHVTKVTLFYIKKRNGSAVFQKIDDHVTYETVNSSNSNSNIKVIVIFETELIVFVQPILVNLELLYI